jgi:hypothetical protein
MAHARPAVPLAWERFLRRYEAVDPEHVAELRAALRGVIPELAEVRGAIDHALVAAAALAHLEGLDGFASWATAFSPPLATTPLAERTATREAAIDAVASVCPLDAEELSDDGLIRRVLARQFPVTEAAHWAMYAAARAALGSLPPSDPARLERAHWLAILAWELARRERH